jgi:uncharacterized protein (TIGR02597 family)
MKLLLTISSALVAAALAFNLHAQSVTTDPVGYVTLEVEGIGATVLGVPLLREEVFRSALVSVDGNELTFLSGLDAIPTNEGQNYFLQIMSGSYAGVNMQIFSLDSDQTLTTTEDISSLLQPEMLISIRRHWTLSDLFGPANESGFIFGGNSAFDPNADRLIIDGITYYYKSGGFGGTGWRTASNQPANDVIVWPTDAIVLIRRVDSPSSYVASGSVNLVPPLVAIETGTNRISTLLPVGVTLAESGLYNTESPFSIRGGNSAFDPAADRLIVGNTVYYYKSGGFGGTGWRTSGNLDANDIIIPSAVTLIRRGDPSNLKLPVN